MTVWLSVSSSEVLRNCYRSPVLVLIFFGRFPLPETAWGMSFFEKKTEKIHRGSPPTVHTHTQRSGRTRSHTHTAKLSHTVKRATQADSPYTLLAFRHTLIHAVSCTSTLQWCLLGNIRHPGRKEDRLFPHLDSMDTSDVGLNIESMLTIRALTQPVCTALQHTKPHHISLTG